MGQQSEAGATGASKGSAIVVWVSPMMMRCLLVILAAIAPPWTSSLRGASDVLDDWVSREYQSFVQGVLGGDAVQDTRGADATRLMVRVIPSGLRSETELLFVVDRTSAGRVLLTTVKPVGGTLREQLRGLRSEHPEWQRDQYVRAARVERSSIDVATSSKLGAYVRELLRAKVDLVPATPMFLDPTSYSIQSNTSTGEVKVEMLGPGPSSPRQPNTVLTLIEEIRELTKSGSSQKKGTGR